MPVCQKCGVGFPNRIVLDGRERVLCRRKFCLTCSPFGERGAKKSFADSLERVCKRCDRIFQYSCSAGHRPHICNSCSVRERSRAYKLKAIAYKGGGCLVCSYSKTPASLAFHHLNPERKDFNIGGSYCRSWNVIQLEVDKCVLLCLNCHGEHHIGLISTDELKSLELKRLNQP